MNRVVVTGIGVVSPVGSTLDAFWSALTEPRSGITPISIIPTERLNAKVAAQVLDFNAEAHFDPRRANLMDRFAQFAVVAARAAVHDSGLPLDDALKLEAATIVGTGVGGQNTQDAQYFKLYAENAKKLHPLTIPRLMVNAAASHVSMDLGLKGPTYSVATACASGTHAIGQAFHMLRMGQAPVAIVGGTDACITVGTIKGWEGLRVLASDTCRPFSMTRSGFVLGEGAAMFVLELLEHAQERRAAIYAEVLGGRILSDARHVTSLDANSDVLTELIRYTLKDSALCPRDVTYVNAHGTGTKQNDLLESRGIRSAFGRSASSVSVSANKAMLGHLVNASGSVELAITALALRDGFAPPTLNLTHPDPECDIDCVPLIGRAQPLEHALKLSIAFGGHLTAIALRRWTGREACAARILHRKAA